MSIPTHIQIASVIPGILCLAFAKTVAAPIHGVDAVSGASIRLDSGRASDTSATLFWHESKINGKLRLFWDTVPLLSYPLRAMDSLEWTFLPNQIRSVRAQTATFPDPGQVGLKPSTRYWFFLQGFYPYPDDLGSEPAPWASMPSSPEYFCHGSFTTSASVANRPGKPERRIRTPRPIARDARGRIASGISTKIDFFPGKAAVKPSVRTKTEP